MSKAFISKSSINDEIAMQVCNYLEERNIKCWIAPRDQIGGKEYPAQIVEAINNCENVIVIMSEDAMESDAVNNEIEIASQHSKPIITFKIENVTLNEQLRYYLSRKHWIEAFDDFEQGLKVLYKNISPFGAFLEEYSGKLLPRTELEHKMGSPDERFSFKNNIQSISIICYTSASIINLAGVVNNRRKEAPAMAKAIEDLLEKDDEFSLNLTITNPNSKASAEAICNGKLGNRTFNRRNDNAFSSAWNSIISKLRDADNIYKRRLDDGNFEFKLTDVSLPYALMRVEYKAGYKDLNYIKLDIYSPYIESNSSRRSIVVSQRYQPDNYQFFEEQIHIINENAIDFESSALMGRGVFLHKADEIEKAVHTKYRQYFTGNVRFKKGNMKNFISYVETGISAYAEYTVYEPHYHDTTAEHYFILEGEQKILDLENEKQMIAQKGEFVFIPAGTRHITKNKAGTRVFFAKAPDKSDKKEVNEEMLNTNLNIEQWMSSYNSDLIE